MSIVNRPDVSILIVNYNTREALDACLASVKANERRASYEIIVVDNASRDGSAEMVRAHHPDATLLALQENTGFSIANNLAGRRARGDYILLLNTDTCVFENAIGDLLDFARRTPSAGIWGGRTVYRDGSLNPTSCFEQYTLWNIFCRATGLSFAFPRNRLLNSSLYGNWQRDAVRPVDVVAGCFLLITRDLWERLGGLDTEFFLYGEDMDLCMRARALGHQPLFTPAAEIVHDGEGSQPERSDKLVRSFTGMCRIIAKHYRFPRDRLARAMVLVWPLTRIAGYGLAGVLDRRRGDAKLRLWQAVWRARKAWTSGVFPEIDRVRHYDHV